MTFLEAIKICLLKKYACFEGRARRSEYWYFSLFTGCFSITVNVEGLGIVSIILSSIASLVFFIPSLSVCVRRLHDVNKSGWWYLIAFTIIGIFYLLYLMVKEGDHGDNQYGPDPKGEIFGDNESTAIAERKDEIEKLGGDSVI